MLIKLGKLFIRNHHDLEDPVVRSRYGILCAWYGVITNTLIAIGKMILGFLMGSIAILADGVNNLMDSASSIITMISFRLSMMPADSEHPYGHQRMEYVGSLIVSFLMFSVGVFFLQSAIQKIISPTPLDLSYFLLITVVLTGSIIVKLSQWILYKQGERLISSVALRASAQDSVNDILMTATVLLALVIFYFTQLNLDGIIGLVVSFFILFQAIVLIKNTISVLLGEAPNPDTIQTIRHKLLSYSGVLGIHDLLIHSYGPKKNFVTVHVEVDAHIDIMKSHELVDRIEQDFLEFNHINLLIHMDPVDMSDGETLVLHNLTVQMIHEIDPLIHLHDFRRTTGKNPKILFDIVVPDTYEMKDELLKEKIIAQMKQKIKKYIIIVTVDRHYF
ncbi:MAG: cation diffusion facilitator family transporter [Bacilli bacterium]